MAKRALLAVCGAHAIQDGLVAVQFVLLPVLAGSLGLSYTQVGVLKAASNTAMAVLEIPSSMLAEKVNQHLLLLLGLVGAGVGYIGVSWSAGFVVLALFFLLAGCGAAFQHSLSSSIVVQHFAGAPRRRALGIYNSAGDVGKLAYTASFGLLLGAGAGWSKIVLLLGLSAVLFALVVYGLLQSGGDSAKDKPDAGQLSAEKQHGWGIRNRLNMFYLGAVTFLDSVVQVVFFTFIGFVVMDKSGSSGMAAAAVVLTLAGGMVGKLAGGYLSASLGDRRSFVIFQLMSIAGLIAVMWLPLVALLLLLPAMGVFLQGSSSIYYGVVPEHVDEAKQSRGYALIYTVANVASVLGPFTLGLVADFFGLMAVFWVLVVITAITLLPVSIFSHRISG